MAIGVNAADERFCLISSPSLNLTDQFAKLDTYRLYLLLGVNASVQCCRMT